MCFSLDDILFILDIIKDNKEKFNNLEKYNFFVKTIEKISAEEANDLWSKSMCFKLGKNWKEGESPIEMCNSF